MNAGEKMSNALLQRALENFNNNFSESTRTTAVLASQQKTVKSYTNDHTFDRSKLLKVGDFVRVNLKTLNKSLLKDVTYKSSHVKHWSDKIYKIVQVVIPRTVTMQHYYLLENEADKRFYEHDLLHVPSNNPLPIQKAEKIEMKKEVKTKSKQKQAEENELIWQRRRIMPTTEKRIRKPNVKK